MTSRISRRDVLYALPGMFGLRALLGAQQAAGSFATVAMNHVTLTVANARRSIEFYQRLFGLPIVATQGTVPILRLGPGPQFIALSERPTAKPGIDHVCLTIQQFEVERVMKALAGFGVMPAEPGAAGGLSGGPLRARVRMRGESAGGAKEGTPEIYFGDPDGITIQLQAPAYCGGSGLLGELCSSSTQPAGKPPLVTREMNHVTLAVSDPKRSLDFYQRLFGLPVVARQGSIPIMRVGRGPAFIALNGAGTASPGIHHVCVTIDDFDPDRAMRTLAELGVKKAEGAAGPLTARIRMRGPEAGGAKEGTPELYFTDPDGNTIQLQDARYCGGAGRVGEVCSSA